MNGRCCCHAAGAKTGGHGVIASRLCAELYNLEILKENIETMPRILRGSCALEGGRHGDGNKCSIIFSVSIARGLFSVLEICERGINMTRIESRPLRNDPGSYAFSLTLRGPTRMSGDHGSDAISKRSIIL